MAGALDGIRVLDLGRFASCPVCGALLADLGAEVIRVERPGGEEDRYHGLLSPSGDNYLFISRNRNKKAITLNYARNDKAKEILNELVKLSDVLLENFGLEAAEAMGITYDNFKKVKPDIIFAHISAFGMHGPYGRRIGFDQTNKAISGSMSMSGFPGPPTREQTPWIDYGAASLTALGVVAALHHRQKTGQGQMVDVSLLQTALSYVAPYIAEWETGGKLREQVGNRGHYMGPDDTYQTKDGRWVMVTILTNSLWRRFCQFIGREDLVNDPRFQNDYARWEHRDIIDPVVEQWVASRTAAEVLAVAEKIPIPCGICYNQTEVAHDPQVKAEGMLAKVPFPDGRGEVIAASPAIGMSATPLKIERSFPVIGQHNEEIYGQLLGYSRKDLARFKEEGVI